MSDLNRNYDGNTPLLYVVDEGKRTGAITTFDGTYNRYAFYMFVGPGTVFKDSERCLSKLLAGLEEKGLTFAPIIK